MNLHVHESSAATAAPRGTVVFLHGFPFDGSMWAPQLSALSPGWRGLAPDLRGFGASGIGALPGEVSTGKRTGGRIARRSEPVLTMARLADDVITLMDERGLEQAVICGLSMGGYVAFELWRRHPDRIRALVLADTRAGADDDEARENRLRMAHAARSAGSRPIAASMVPALLSTRTLDEEPDIVESVKDMILRTAPETLIAALAGMAARHDSTVELADISIPTLVLAGEHDAITPPEDARAMAAALPDGSFTGIPDAGHLSNVENPAAFNHALHSFLERV